MRAVVGAGCALLVVVGALFVLLLGASLAAFLLSWCAGCVMFVGGGYTVIFLVLTVGCGRSSMGSCELQSLCSRARCILLGYARCSQRN